VRWLFLFAAGFLQSPQEPESSAQLSPEVLKSIKAATVVIIRKRSGEVDGTGFLISPVGHILTFREGSTRERGFPGPKGPEQYHVVLDSGTESQRTVPAQVVVDQIRDGGLLLLSIEGRDLPSLQIETVKELAESAAVWGFGFNLDRAPAWSDIVSGKKGPEVGLTPIRYRPSSVGSPGQPGSFRFSEALRLGFRGGPVVGTDGRVYGMLDAKRGGMGGSSVLTVEAIEEFRRPKIVRFLVEPQELPAEGGSVTIQAEIEARDVPVERATVVVESPGFRHEVELVRQGKEWSGTWTCPALDAAGLQRLEADALMKDGAVRRVVCTATSVTLKKGAEVLQIPVGELQEIRPGQGDEPDRVRTSKGSFEGRLEPRLPECGETLEAGQVSVLRLGRRSGRMLGLRLQAKYGSRDVRSPGVPVAVGRKALAPPAPVSFLSSLKEERIEKTLPAAIHQVRMAGGGKVLLLHFKSLRTLGVFDLETLQVVKQIRLDADSVLFAGGRTHVLICFPDEFRIERWSLSTLALEETASIEGRVLNLELGWNSDGPALLLREGGKPKERLAFALFDVESLTAFDLLTDASALGLLSRHLHVRLSPSGRHFGWCRQTVAPNTGDSSDHPGFGMGHIRGHSVEHATHFERTMNAVPSDDGAFLFSSDGVFLFESLLWRLNKAPRPRTEPEAKDGLPTVDPSLYLSLTFKRGEAGAEQTLATVNTLTGNRKVATLDFPLLDKYWFREKPGELLTRDQRVWFHPEAKVLVTIPTTNDRLVCRRLDLDAMMTAAGLDYLYVNSAPPHYADRGRDWTYAVRVKSKQGGVAVKLVTAPEGMKLGSDNVLSWRPSSVGASDVKLVVTDRSGQEVEHAFTVTVR
jgi:hypothetical protein